MKVVLIGKGAIAHYLQTAVSEHGHIVDTVG